VQTRNMLVMNLAIAVEDVAIHSPHKEKAKS
jgi:hypothetical protein